MNARILISPSPDVRRTVLPRAQGGLDARDGLASRLAGTASAFATATLGILDAARTGAVLRCVTSASDRFDALILSLVPDIRDTTATPGDTERNLVDIARVLEQRFGARTLVMNCSSFDPEDSAHTYAGSVSEPLPLRAHRFNIALISAAQQSGLSVIDVDSVAAEAGGAEHVRAPFTYSAHLHAIICREIAEQLRERVTPSDAPETFVLTMPRYDRRIAEVLITKWRKSPGESVRHGDALLEVRADNLSWRLEDASERKKRSTARSLGLLVSSRGDGVLRRIYVAEGSVVRIGERIGLITSTAGTSLPEVGELDGRPRFPTMLNLLASRADEDVG